MRDSYYIREDWISYFEKKKQEIQESLFQDKTSQPQDAVSTVLAVLHITPIELGFTPMAHYTSPHVCHILFGIDGNEIDCGLHTLMVLQRAADMNLGLPARSAAPPI